ncbi:MAG TPA: alpha/beta fold hydrolase [Byssovorax sp.]|jgi:pimeloyl-ACP methyl ester carboxylesterase
MSKRRVAKKLGFGLAALLAAGAAFEWLGARADARRYAEVGRRVDVGDGRAMFLDCRGEGAPVVVLEAGHHGWSPAWASVEPEVAKMTRVCSYDRAGLGASDPGPRPRVASAITADLARLLHRAGIQAPYVLVGHSAGGMYQRLFFHAHPSEVAGLVLVDTDEPTDDADRAEVAHAPDDRRAALLLTAAVHTGVLRFATQVLGVESDASRRYPEEAKVRMRAAMGPLARAMNDEWTSYQSAYTTVTDAPFGDRPLVVLGALGYLPDPADRADRRARQERLAALSTRGELRMFADELHELPLLRPDLVVAAIDDVVRRCRTSPSGAPGRNRTSD